MKQQVAVPTQTSRADQKGSDPPGQTNVAIGTLSRFSDSIIENVNVWLNVLDTQLNIVVWNHVAEAISGYSREEVIGHNLTWNWLYPDEEYCRAITTRTAALLDRDGGARVFRDQDPL